MGKLNWKATALTLLFIFTAAMLSFSSTTMAHYTAQGNLQASAKVAQWKITVENRDGNTVRAIPASNGIIKLRDGQSTANRIIVVKNESEVAATPALPKVELVPGSARGAATINFSIQNQVAFYTGGPVAPGESAYFTMQYQGSGNDGYAMYRIIVDTAQED